MTKTFKSRSPIILDVPDPPRPEVEFVYNFFQPDEKTNDSGAPVNQADYLTIATGLGVSGLPEPTFDQLTQMKNIPRFIRISFDSLPGSWENTHSSTWYNGHQPGTIKDLDESGVIQEESSITTQKYESVTLQDSTVVSRMRENIKLAINMRLAAHQTSNGSPAEYAQFMDSITSDEVDSNMLLEAITDLYNDDPNVGASLSYVNEVGDQVQTNFLANQMSERFHISLHENFRADILRSSISSPFSPYKKSTLTSEYKYLDMSNNEITGKGLAGLTAAQNVDRQLSTPDIDIVADYSPTILAVSAEPADQNNLSEVSSQNNTSILMGYIVEKHEILPSGERRGSKSEPSVPSLYYDRSTAQAGPVHIIDSKIKYGKIYAYSVRSVYRLKIDVLISPGQSTVDPTGGVYTLTVFVKSTPSPEAVVKCDEIIAPGPPDGLTFDYLYSNNALLIHWQMPGNSQNDVKKFQVFRRRTIMAPFTLIAEYNFDNSVIPTPTRETPHQKNVHYVSWPQNGHVDAKFNRDSNFIYAVCAIDAHGFSSKYSTQMRVKFVREKNKIEVSYVSQPGAPKQYPNFFVSRFGSNDWNGMLAETEIFDLESPNPARSVRVTEDAMRDSNHRKMRVYFDPEYLKMESTTGENIQRFIHSGEYNDPGSPRYKFHIINVDRQKGRSVEVQIRDKNNYTI
jgi:hypothetical protein